MVQVKFIDKDNRLVKTKLSNGITQDVNYDDRSREEKREYTRNGQIVYSQTTQYDSNSNVVREDIVEQNTNIIKEYWSGNLNSDT
ncbi:hypothetical protein ACH5BK_03190 [Arcobacter sp. YIC-80]|uniref:hypothetical protein n=1 Tax=Arcobacter sp. YIC-80 TaxID=3376683 RepID=UPI00384BB2B8